MASEYDLKGPISLGASAVIYSGHKFLSGTTSGIVAGGSGIVRATYLQRRGIGRTMKAGKEMSSVQWRPWSFGNGAITTRPAMPKMNAWNCG